MVPMNRQSEQMREKCDGKVIMIDSANPSHPERNAADPEYAGEDGESWVDLVEIEQKSLEITPALREGRGRSGGGDG